MADRFATIKSWAKFEEIDALMQPIKQIDTLLGEIERKRIYDPASKKDIQLMKEKLLEIWQRELEFHKLPQVKE